MEQKQEFACTTLEFNLLSKIKKNWFTDTDLSL